MTSQDSFPKKNILYIDTSQNLSLGLADEKLNWLSFETTETKKSSSLAHKLIFNLLESFNVSMEDICLVYCSGPGSYTGMRVARGIGEIFDWQKIPTYSFHMYRIPALLGHQKGRWISEAFKQEYFVYNWDNQESSTSLLGRSALEELLKEDHSWWCHDRLLPTIDKSFISTQELISKNAPAFLKSILEHDLHQDLYYYRSIETEFTQGK